MMIDILVVDDKADIRRLVSETIIEEYYDRYKYIVECADSIQTTIQAIEKKPKVVILDIWLEGSHNDGINLLKIIKQKLPLTQVIMMSGHGNIDIAVQTTKLGAYDFIEKPFKTSQLLTTLKEAMEYHNALIVQSSVTYTSQETKFVGQDEAIIRISKLAESIAMTDSAVLIEGDYGVGKSTLAQIIHDKSHRNGTGSFIRWHICNKSAAMLLEDIVGNVHSSSVILKANGGTLFVKEIADMPLSIQHKLLHILQTKSIEINNVNYDIDFRIIASTKKNIMQVLDDGSFSEQLYYCLNVARINIPRLSERIGDIELLAQHFLGSTSNAMYKKTLTDAAIEVMKKYDWPGNVQQLKNVIEWMLIVTASDQQSKKLDVEVLPPELRIVNSEHARMSIYDFFEQPIKEAKRSFEEAYIDYQLKKNSHNVSKTAEAIGLNRAALHRKIVNK